VLTGNGGLRVGLKLLQCQFGNKKLCRVLEQENVGSTANGGSDVKVTVSCG
jgi:hypothetical protein